MWLLCDSFFRCPEKLLHRFGLQMTTDFIDRNGLDERHFGKKEHMSVRKGDAIDLRHLNLGLKSTQWPSKNTVEQILVLFICILHRIIKNHLKSTKRRSGLKSAVLHHYHQYPGFWRAVELGRHCPHPLVLLNWSVKVQFFESHFKGTVLPPILTVSSSVESSNIETRESLNHEDRL